jgi:DNA-binding transcriptional ArsR family regulator
VFRLLVRAGAAGLPAGQVAERLDIPAATLSFHLSQFKHAGLVHARRDGRLQIYAVNYDAMNALMGFLTENCCAGDMCSAPVCTTATAPVIRTNVTRKGARR